MKKINRFTANVLYEVKYNRELKGDIKELIEDIKFDIGYGHGHSSEIAKELEGKLFDYFMENIDDLSFEPYCEMLESLFSNLLHNALEKVDFKYIAKQILKKKKKRGNK